MRQLMNAPPTDVIIMSSIEYGHVCEGTDADCRHNPRRLFINQLGTHEGYEKNGHPRTRKQRWDLSFFLS